MLPDVIESYIRTHYGYGNLNGKYWLVGMEEGHGGGIEELIRRFQIWDDFGRNETDDVVEYHFQLGMPQFFQEPVKLQHTWAHLIRLVLAAEGRSAGVEAVKAYQKNFLGRPVGETCLLELLPLPSPSTVAWHYGEWTGLSYLKSRDEYKRTCISRRMAHLKEMIDQYCPPVVVFYGITFRPYYEQIAGSPFEQDGDDSAWARKDGTLFVLVKHPAAWGEGANAVYFEKIGREIRKRMGESRSSTKTPHIEIPVERYGLYKCDSCGKMVMGYDQADHTRCFHNNRVPGYTKIR